MIVRNLLAGIILLGVLQLDISGQNWNELIPMVSTCGDVRRVLNIRQCEQPVMIYKSPDYLLRLEFFTKGAKLDGAGDGRCLTEGTVKSISISLSKGIALRDHESDLLSYKVLSVPDLPDYLRLVSQAKGVELSVVNFPEVSPQKLSSILQTPNKNRDSYANAILGAIAVQNIHLFPSSANQQRCKCMMSLRSEKWMKYS